MSEVKCIPKVRHKILGRISLFKEGCKRCLYVQTHYLHFYMFTKIQDVS